jgi:hypothetical protein
MGTDISYVYTYLSIYLYKSLALRASLVPVFSFGENDLFKQVNNSPGTWLRQWQLWFMRYAGFAPCMPYGRGIFNYDFGLLPQRHPIVTVGTCRHVLHQFNYNYYSWHSNRSTYWGHRDYQRLGPRIPRTLHGCSC